jgi:CRP-like cAMP-binding protein
MTTMKNQSLAVLDTPAPTWFATAPHAGSWSSWLVQGTHYGKVIDMGVKQPLVADTGDFFILLSGCIVVYGVSKEGSSKPVFVDALRRGDVICPLMHDQVKFIYETRTPAQLLRVSKEKYPAFMNDLRYSETVLLAAELHLMAKHSNAAQFHFAKDLERIKRVVNLLVQHPDSVHTPRGIEVHASKEEIRNLAGVERRSGSRAFKILEDEGVINFNGYKAFFYITPRREMA